MDSTACMLDSSNLKMTLDAQLTDRQVIYALTVVDLLFEET